MSDKKLIRLTTVDRNCIFSNEFHDEIIIKEKSEIAFQSVSMIKEPTRLIIESSNDLGSFQIQDVGGGFGGLHNFHLPHGTFSDTNFEQLTTEFEDDLNRALDFRANIEHGTIAVVGVSQAHKFFISFERDPFIDMNSLFFQNFACTISGPNQTLTRTLDLPVPFNSFALANANYSFALTKGCGSFRARVHTHINHATGGADNGFYMGLTKSPQKLRHTVTGVNNFTLADMDFAIKVPTVNTGNYVSIINGSETISSTTMLKFNDSTPLNTHDYLDISLSGGHIIGAIYQDGSETELFRVQYDYVNKPTYYGFIIPMAGASNIIADAIRCTVTTESITMENSPTLFNQVGLRGSALTYLLGDTTTNIPEPRPLATPSNYEIRFPSFDTARYLGYTQQNLTLVANPPTIDPMFVALEGFQPVQDSDVYLVELLNLPLNSYDGFSEGRKNILAVIPVNERNVGQKDSVLQYEANTLNYITLKNDYEFSLRNIRARIVNARFEPIITEGLSSLTFYIRQYKE